MGHRHRNSPHSTKTNSLVCSYCEGNGVVACCHCKGGGVNLIDHFNGQFKVGALCWLCRPVIGLLYPLYETVRAIETREGDGKKWLTYWVIYSLITLIELTFYTVIQWIPMWSYVKLFLTWWLVLPGYNGAAQLYDQFFRQYIILPSNKEDDDHLPAGKYTEKHLTWADTSAKYIGRSAFDDDDYDL